MRNDSRLPVILIVEDDRPLCAMLVDVLTEAGYETRFAFDGEAAWREIQAHPPDLVLSDITMPRLDGVSLARRLATTAAAIPIILMTAGDGAGAAAVSAALVSKPFDLTNLLAQVADLLVESSGPRPPGPA